jgi:hypothetical protein
VLISVRKFETDSGIVQISAEREAAESEFGPPARWKLIQRREMDCKMPDGKEQSLFHEKWFHPESQSGIVTYSSFEARKAVCSYGYAHEAADVYYVIEGYGIGTLDAGFREIGDIAPIQRTEHATLDQARQALRALMEDNEALFRGEEFRNRQAAIQQLPKEERQPSNSVIEGR